MRVRCRPSQTPRPQTIGEADQREVVADIEQAADLDIAEEVARLEDVIGVDAEDHLGGVLEDEEDGVGDEQDQHFVAAVEQPQQAALDQRRDDDGHRQSGDEHGDQAEGGGRPQLAKKGTATAAL